MIQQTEYKSQYNKVKMFLSAGRLADAIMELRKLVAQAGDTRLRDRLMETTSTYRYMLSYMVKGVEDAGRETMLTNLTEQLHSIADAALREIVASEGADIYSSALRLNRIRNSSIKSLLDTYSSVYSEITLADLAGNDATALREHRENIKEEIFNRLLTIQGFREDATVIRNEFDSAKYDESLRKLIISALSLSLSFYYSEEAIAILLDIFERNSNEILSSRALVGLLLAMAAYPDRIRANRQFASRLSMWNDDMRIISHLRKGVRAIIGTRDTDRVTAKMKDEVIPELMKLRPDILKKMRESGGEIDQNMLDNNPEWEEILNESGLGEKMRELAEMQQDGADFMMVTFAGLKQFPFFNKAFNWLNPFEIANPSLSLSKDLQNLLGKMTEMADAVPDSDKFSLALGLKSMPEHQRQIIISQMSAQMEQLSEMSKEASESIDGTHSEFDREILRVVRDLYRFFKLYRNRKNLRDPFVSFFDFTALPIVGEVLTEEESIIPFTEFYFKRGLYAEALPLLEKLSTLRPEDSSVWEKIGFSRQSTRDFTGALEAYRRAELFKTPGPWLLKKIAYINKRLGNNAESAEYYRRALDSDPENASLLMSLGNVLILLNRPEEASAQFYHANYIRPSDPKIMRSIGWTELLKKNPIKSLDYYRRVLSIDPNPSDYLNAGHASLLTGDMKGAVEYYRKTFSDEETDGFMKAYNSDIPTLLSLGADPQILRLVADYLLLSE